MAEPTSTNPGQLLLDVNAMARALSVSPRTVAELTRLGKLPHVRLQRRVLYPLDRVRDYIASITKGGPGHDASAPL